MLTMQFGTKRTRIALLIVLLSFGISLAGADEPAWLRYERARAAFEAGELGVALRHYRAAVELESVFPEAEAGIGMVLAAEGAFGPALRQLQNALQNADALRIPDHHFQIRYQVADIHRLQGSLRDFERTLREIISFDEAFVSDRTVVERNARRRIFLTNGLDRMVQLYRLEYHPAMNAHRLLAELHIREQSYGEAIDHLLAANLQAFTIMIEALREIKPLFEFRDMADLLDEIRAERTLRRLVADLLVYEHLYLLAAATYGYNAEYAQSRQIWSLLADDADAGVWARRAQMQLRSPRADALVDY